MKQDVLFSEEEEELLDGVISDSGVPQVVSAVRAQSYTLQPARRSLQRYGEAPAQFPTMLLDDDAMCMSW